ncbi:MAG TPA: OmpA family protein [Verrucomicrobiae bacterium]|nr:OmpA family protein [Verrucomicrobiae bacterium]
MKLNKMILSAMIALVAVGATTGCRKGYSKITPIPGMTHNAPGSEQGPSTLPPGGQFPPGFDPNATTTTTPSGPIPTTADWDPNACDQDRAALADQTVHFAFDSAAVLSKEESKLIIVSEKLKSDPSAKLLIEGHCDERGTEEYNRSLGERRALALREALVHAGIEAERIRTISYGKDKPADPGHDDAAWSKNRRGEFVLCHLKAGA